MNLNSFQNILFLGIGGIGISALAKYFHKLGKNISGYDFVSSVITKQLENEGIHIFYHDSINEIKQKPDIVIYTPAIPKENNILKEINNLNIPLFKRSEVLQWITNENHTIAVSGTHGKTSTTAILAHLFYHSDIKINAFVGGLMVNDNTNFITSKQVTHTITEADEFDKSFLKMNPQSAIITSIDADHLDIYKNFDDVKFTFVKFIENIDINGNLLIHHSLKDVLHLNRKYFTYSLTNSNADYYAKITNVIGYSYEFSIYYPFGEIKNLLISMGGKHNIENSIAAIAMALLYNIPNNHIVDAIKNFKGVKRRYELILQQDDVVFIDDYAHHPKEIETVIKSLRENYKNKKITGVFQPHLYSRTRDFENEFANALKLLDELFLLDIYPAREKPIKNVSSKNLLDKIKLKNKVLISKEDLIFKIKESKIEVLITMGAGDISDMVNNIKNAIIKK